MLLFGFIIIGKNFFEVKCVKNKWVENLYDKSVELACLKVGVHWVFEITK